MRGAPADGEGAGDRAARRAPARGRRLPAAHGATVSVSASAGRSLRSRFAAKCEIELEAHSSVVVLGGAMAVSRRRTTAFLPSRCSTRALEPTIADDELELLRIRAGTPRFGREIDDRVLPAEAGLDARAVDFEKGCYPGQEPIARQHYRGRVNRTLRVLEIDGSELPEYDAELALRGEGRRSRHERDSRRRSRRRARLRSRRGARAMLSSASGSAR